MEKSLEDMAAGTTPLGQRRRRIAQAIFLDPDEYLGHFFGADGWLARAEGKNEEALALVRSAADLEDSTEKHPVTPAPVLPAG